MTSSVFAVPTKQSGRLTENAYRSARREVLKRWFGLLFGPVMVCLGLFHHPTILGKPFPLWKTVLVVLSGLFLTYRSAMYYFPSNRRKRDELTRLLDEAEAELEDRDEG